MVDDPPVVCRNCEAKVEHTYCPVCGQGGAVIRLGFGALIRDFFEGYLGYDSALRRTLLPLFTRPGRLTRDYLDGKRKRFFSPLRFYIFCSILLFLFLDLSPIGFAMKTSEEKTAISFMAAGDEIPEEAVDGEAQYSVNLLPEDYWIGRWLNPIVQRQIDRLKMLSDDAKVLVIGFEAMSAIPKALFLMLPFIALFLKLLLLGTGALYFDHFVLTLHAQSFLFLLVTVLTRALPIGWVLLVVAIVMPVYWFLSLRTVYGIRWYRNLFTLGVLAVAVVTTAAIATVGLVSYAFLRI